MTKDSSISIVALAYPGCTLLDLIGPHASLTQIPGAQTAIYWKSRGPILTDSGATILADRSFEEVPENPTVLLVPGGNESTMALLNDTETLAWLKRVGEKAQWVTSVCSGSLVLGAAGLLQGYRATSHWAVKAQLPKFGAILSEGRVVTDRNRMTGAGVSAGIDFGLTLVAELAGVQTAKALQLGMEYDPKPPFEVGTPELAGPELTAQVLASFGLERGSAAMTHASSRLQPQA